MSLHIFKSGKHTDMSGTSLSFTEADLMACAACYDPAKHEAPLVLGHPTAAAPAYGWVKSLSFAEGSLLAEPDQIEVAFAEAVEAGRYKKISASFYLPNSSSNPVPGSYYLRHVGFLGAQVPAVKGLKPIEFAGSEKDCVTVEFAEPSVSIMRLLGSLRDWVIEKFGREAADKALPAWDVDWAHEQAVRNGDSNFSEPSTQGDSEMKDKGDQGTNPGTEQEQSSGSQTNVQGELDALKAQNAQFAEQLRRRDASETVKGLIDAGKLTPAQSVGLVDYMAGLDDGTATVEFGEGEEKKALAPSKFLAEFLNRLPAQVDFSEQSKGSGEDDSVAGVSPEELANEAVSYRENMKKNGIVMTATEAVDAVRAGKNKESANG